MLIDHSPKFLSILRKIKNKSERIKIKKRIKKIIKNPYLGKPMRYARKGTREVYIEPYWLSYCYLKKEDKLIFLDIYHKDEQ